MTVSGGLPSTKTEKSLKGSFLDTSCATMPSVDSATDALADVGRLVLNQRHICTLVENIRFGFKKHVGKGVYHGCLNPFVVEIG